MWFFIDSCLKALKGLMRETRGGVGKGPDLPVPQPALCSLQQHAELLPSQPPLWGVTRGWQCHRGIGYLCWIQNPQQAQEAFTDLIAISPCLVVMYTRANFKAHTWHSITRGCLRCTIRIRITSNRRPGLRGFAKAYTACLWEPSGIRRTASRVRATEHYLSHSSTFTQSTLPLCANLG